jgi:hypothetical protein
MKSFTATSISIVFAALVANCGGADNHGVGGSELSRDSDSEPPDTQEHSGDDAQEHASDDARNDRGSDDENGDDGGLNEDAAGMSGAGTGGTDFGATTSGGTATSLGGAASSTGGTDASGECAGAATGGSGSDVTPAISAVAWLQPDSCERTAAYEVRDVRDQNGMPVTNYTCQWTFSDGGVENTCAGNKSFGELPGTFHGTVVVRDSATGATTTATSETVRVIEPQAIEIWVSSDTCMQFSYDIDRQYGCGGTHVFDIQPAENILTPGPWSTSSQTLQVSTPGVYTLEYTVEGCAAAYARTCITSKTATVAVAACP